MTAEIVIVDDDVLVQRTLANLLGSQGFSVVPFLDGRAFLDASFQTQPICILLDVRLPKISGINILKELRSRGSIVPVIMISGVADIPMAVDAILGGACDFIEKPFFLDGLMKRINRALENHSNSNAQTFVSAVGVQSIPNEELLTPRERELLAILLEGATSKEAAQKLRLSPRTVEEYRGRILKKYGARNIVDLVQKVRDGC